MTKVSIKSILAMKDRGEKISALTAYDVLFASFLDEAGIDIILVGDSLGMVVNGHESTLPVTLEEIIYHTKAVGRGVKRALLVADMPFMSYQISPEQALENAGRILKETSAECVKMEGGIRISKAIQRCVETGIPVMGHLGMTPQSVNQFGGYKIQANTVKSVELLINDALAVEAAGACSIVLEKIPSEVAKEISEKLSIPTIGIGAGVHTDGQILVTQDMLGMFEKFHPKFVRFYANLAEDIKQAVGNYHKDIKNGQFPSDEESF